MWKVDLNTSPSVGYVASYGFDLDIDHGSYIPKTLSSMELRKEEVVSSTPCPHAELVALLPLPSSYRHKSKNVASSSSLRHRSRNISSSLLHDLRQGEELLYNKLQGGLLTDPCHVSYSDTSSGGLDPSYHHFK